MILTKVRGGEVQKTPPREGGGEGSTQVQGQLKTAVFLSSKGWKMIF